MFGAYLGQFYFGYGNGAVSVVVATFRRIYSSTRGVFGFRRTTVRES